MKKKGKNDLEIEGFKAGANDCVVLAGLSRTPEEAASRIGIVGEGKSGASEYFDCASVAPSCSLLCARKVNGTASISHTTTENDQQHRPILQLLLSF